jgi:hypothetical protein
MARITRFLLPACIVAAIALVGAAAQGGGPSWPANVQVSENTGNPQAETSLAADPNDPQHLVAVWWEVTTITPEGRDKRLNYGWSRDGGQTWQSRRIENGIYSSDPAIVADSQGNFYIETIMDPPSTIPPAPGLQEVGIYKSTDGGETFAKVADAGFRVASSIDKPYIAVDPLSDALYVTWTDFLPVPGIHSGRILLTVSTDHGATFSAPTRISDPSAYGSMAVPAVGPDGEAYVVWGSLFSGRIWFDRSLDRGLTWLRKDRLVTAFRDLQGKYANIFPAIAVDRSHGPHRGRIYVVWHDLPSGDIDVYLAWSDDRGENWSTPVRVNDDAVGNGVTQFLDWVVVDDHGRVHVTYTNRLADPDLRAEYMATSTDGGVTFGPNIRVSDGYYPAARFWGDYNQPAAAGNRLHAIWANARFGHNEVFTQSVNLDDFDEDGILNDGDQDGQNADHRCTGGAAAHCDDNCPGTPNPDQSDADHDGIGDACDAA